jgi:hypothetical protein
MVFRRAVCPAFIMTTNGESGILQGIEKILVLRDFEELGEA